VSASIVVPAPQKPLGGDNSSDYYATAWVGIDGTSCQQAIFQTGVDLVYSQGSVSYTRMHAPIIT
jgi:hypothetical protein